MLKEFINNLIDKNNFFLNNRDFLFKIIKLIELLILYFFNKLKYLLFLKKRLIKIALKVNKIQLINNLID